MNRPALCNFCVYTIVRGKRLTLLASKKRLGAFEERKRWVTGHRLWQQAGANKEVMPILFGDASHCSRLMYWAVLTDVDISGETTRFRVDRLRLLGRSRSTQELTLRSTGKKIARNFIRPYAICRTPQFIQSSYAV